MTGHGAVYSKIPIIIKICKTNAFEMFFFVNLLLFRIEVVWKNFNLQDVGRNAANRVPTVWIYNAREIQRGNMDIKWKLYKLWSVDMSPLTQAANRAAMVQIGNVKDFVRQSENVVPDPNCVPPRDAMQRVTSSPDGFKFCVWGVD